MRIWDISPGYLNRQSLLGEHRELHGIVSIIVNRKKGYSHHPETVRWNGFGWALRQRHRALAAEMSLRGYSDRSPVTTRTKNGIWPVAYIDEPFQQFKILENKYRNKGQGRIPLPKNAQELWRHHKYSVLARDVNLYRKLGRDISGMKPHYDFSGLAEMLTVLLRRRPTGGGIKNALHHMWGYVNGDSSCSKSDINFWSLARLLKETQRRAMATKNSYITASTALSELFIWLQIRADKS
jgi:Pyrimidine dimer DNA glycosylase